MKIMVHDRIKLAREKSGISQSEMAGKIGVVRETYLNLESGKTEPKLNALMGIASITGVTLHWLAYGREDDKEIQLKAIQGKFLELQQMVNSL